MDIKTLESFKLSDAIAFHDELNPNIWVNDRLRPEVKKQLLIIANDFLDELGINDLDVKDITVSGSNAAYSYTPHSDLDLHILVDMSNMPNDEVYRELFTAKKNIYNDNHDIKIHGVPVELYVQDSNEPVVSLGEYSLLNNEWIKLPSKRRANLDQTTTKLKYEKLLDFIKRVLKTKDIVKLNKVIDKIKQYRKAGLDKTGEFGPENLAYKILRTQGYIGKLYALREKLHSIELSLKETENNNLNKKLTPAKQWINKIYDMFYKHPFNHRYRVMTWGEGDNQELAIFELEPVFDQPNTVDIKWFQAYPQRQGIGTRAMQRLQQLAQEDGITLTIYPWNRGEVSQSKLTKIYRGMGFRPTVRGAKDMSWQPQQQSVAEKVVDETLDTKPKSRHNAIWVTSDSDSIEFRFTASNGILYSVNFLADWLAPDEINPWQLFPQNTPDEYIKNGRFVEFEQVPQKRYQRGEQGVAGTGSAPEVMGMVTNAVLEFLQKQKPTYIFFQAAEPNRERLYQTIVNRVLSRIPKYKSKPVTDDGVFVLYRPYKLKENVSDKLNLESTSSKFLSELFDRPYQIKIFSDQAVANDSKGRPIYIDFDRSPTWETVKVTFDRGEGGFSRTGMGDQNRVMSTVVDAIRMWSSQYQPGMIYFAVDTNEPRYEQRYRLYQRIVDKFLPGSEYTDVTGHPEYITGDDTIHWWVVKLNGLWSSGGRITFLVRNDLVDKTKKIDSVNIQQEQSIHKTSNVLGPQLYVARPTGLEEAFRLKPNAFKWTSTAHKVENGYTSEWVEWCKDNMPDWLSTQGILYDIKPGAKVLNINTDQDAIKIAKKYNVIVNDAFELYSKMPWDLIEKDYDCVHHVPAGNNNMFMNFWDTESTAWLNDKFLTNPIKVNIDIGKNNIDECASGYIPSEKEKNDPRFKTALTVDIKPDTMQNNAKKFGNKVSRAGIPPTLRSNGKF